MKLPVQLTAVLWAALASFDAQAHKRWLLPTDFSLSDAETITVDFTASNNIFHVDKPMPLAGVKILSPNGESVSQQSPLEGPRRSSFDVPIKVNGTYRIYDRGRPVYFSSYKLPSETKPVMARGPLQKLKAEIPPEATEVKFAESVALIETYVTLGGDTPPAPLANTQGLIMEPLTHPANLYSDEPAEFRFKLDGSPVENLAVVVTPEGTRYRDDQAEQSYTTNDSGSVSVNWPSPGRYLVEASMEQSNNDGEIALRYLNYFLTVEVLAP